MFVASLLCGLAVFGFVLVIVWVGFKENSGGVIVPGYTLKLSFSADHRGCPNQ